ncbi:hypothetical protein A167_01481 [Alcanivorax sp. S71-1-4]|nr:hypothetical protein A167_01481 [Alcanivorax sp. S71-1-4]
MRIEVAALMSLSSLYAWRLPGEITTKYATQANHQLRFFELRRLPLNQMAPIVRGISPCFFNDLVDRRRKQPWTTPDKLSESIFAASDIACQAFQGRHGMLYSPGCFSVRSP